ncbi:MAG: TlpA family protein disulfide reductase [Paludibacteraceae bacterium]|nr:TlpA family protein disulfide reductase [Paludibacteraceae bacterium]
MKKTILLLLSLVVLGGVMNAQLPSVKLKDIDGKTVDTGTLENDGRPIIISFFATYCKPCIRELKAIHEMYADWQDETGVRIILVSIDQAQDAQKVKPMVNGFGWEYEVLLDPNGDFKRAMNVQNVPHVFVIDGNGKIVHNHQGYTDGQEDELYELIKKL